MSKKEILEAEKKGQRFTTYEGVPIKEDGKEVGVVYVSMEFDGSEYIDLEYHDEESQAFDFAFEHAEAYNIDFIKGGMVESKDQYFNAPTSEEVTKEPKPIPTVNNIDRLYHRTSVTYEMWDEGKLSESDAIEEFRKYASEFLGVEGVDYDSPEEQEFRDNSRA